MAPINKKNIWVLAILIMLFILFSGLSYFFYSKIREISLATKEAENKIASLESEDRAFGDAVKKLEDSAKEIRLLNLAFLGDSNFVDFLKLIESMGKTAGVDLKTESAEGRTLRFKTEGNFASIMRFLVLLDELPYAGIVTSLEIVPLIAPESQEKGPPKTKILQTTIGYAILNFVPAP